jgi:hypothetical protein
VAAQFLEAGAFGAPGPGAKAAIAFDQIVHQETLQSDDPRVDYDGKMQSRHNGYTSIITGFSISALNAPMSWAPSAPSTER